MIKSPHMQPKAGTSLRSFIKGKKMPGRMGGDQRTVQNLEVVKIIAEKNLILIKQQIE